MGYHWGFDWKAMVTKTRTPPRTRVARRAPTARGRDMVVKEAKSSLTEQAYAMIEEAIVTLRIPPGAAVSEQSLSDMTGIGRTPVREAILRLAREHLVQVLPQRGLLVSPIDVGKQLRLLETRRELERLICRSAARRSTPEQRSRFAGLADEFRTAAVQSDDVAFMRSDRDFNELCLAAARNEFAEGAMRTLHGLSRRFWYMHYKEAADMPEMAKLHANVAMAISKGDQEAAVKAHDKLLDNLEGFTRSTVLS